MSSFSPDTLIVFASKYGATAQVAQRVAQGLAAPAACYDCGTKAVTFHNRAQSANLSTAPAGYGTIIIGTPLYIGKPLPAVRKYCVQNERELLSHPLFFFTCGIDTAQEDERYLRASLPASLMQHAALIIHLGGDVVPERTHGFDRLAMKEYVKQHGPAPGLNGQALADLCAAVNRLQVTE